MVETQRTAAHGGDPAEAEIKRLRDGIQKYLEGGHVFDKCEHIRFEVCEGCIEEYFTKLLEAGK